MVPALTTPIRNAARKIAQRLTGSAVVLLYHRVTTLDSDPQLLAVTPEHFDQQMRVLRDMCRLMPLREMTDGLSAGHLPRQAAVITFDDGYADNLHEAKPILERHGLPATVFVASGAIGSHREFYWDELEAILLRPGSLPQTLGLQVGETSYRWHLGESATLSEETFARRRRWSVASPAIHPRQELYKALCALLRTLPIGPQRDAMQQVRWWAGRAPEARATHRAMDERELRSLVADGLIEVGAHTVDHACLASLARDEQREQVAQSRSRLEAIVGRPVTSFSYPYGTRASYDADTATMVREAGLSSACSNFEGVVRPGADLYQVPRFLVRDWPGEEFAARLRSWLDG